MTPASTPDAGFQQPFWPTPATMSLVDHLAPWLAVHPLHSPPELTFDFFRISNAHGSVVNALMALKISSICHGFFGFHPILPMLLHPRSLCWFLCLFLLVCLWWPLPALGERPGDASLEGHSFNSMSCPVARCPQWFVAATFFDD